MSRVHQKKPVPHRVHQKKPVPLRRAQLGKTARLCRVRRRKPAQLRRVRRRKTARPRRACKKKTARPRRVPPRRETVLRRRVPWRSHAPPLKKAVPPRLPTAVVQQPTPPRQRPMLLSGVHRLIRWRLVNGPPHVSPQVNNPPVALVLINYQRRGCPLSQFLNLNHPLNGPPLPLPVTMASAISLAPMLHR